MLTIPIPFGEIKITKTSTKASIYAITPQRHPILFPGVEMLLQFNSDECKEFTLIGSDSEGLEVARYKEGPYFPYPDCNMPADDSYKATHYIHFLFNIPDKYGRYTLEVYDGSKLLTAGIIDLQDPEAKVSVTPRKVECTVSDSKYTVFVDVPYPVLVESTNAEKISVVIKGP
ncbi:MAG: hypothetical protein U9O94_05685, partial [Nanoarchaeota archaeon]|nr:hypothetical protein [Nanoarchaeota archaeon]